MSGPVFHAVSDVLSAPDADCDASAPVPVNSYSSRETATLALGVTVMVVVLAFVVRFSHTSTRVFEPETKPAVPIRAHVPPPPLTDEIEMVAPVFIAINKTRR